MSSCNEKNIGVASEIIKAKILENGGSIDITLLNGKPCKVMSSSDGKTFTSDKLGKNKFDYIIFDYVTDFLMSCEQYTAPKGNSRGKKDKVGYGNCTCDTVTYEISTKYFEKSEGESVFYTTFVIAAIMDWAGIAYNRRKYMTLKPSFLYNIGD